MKILPVEAKLFHEERERERDRQTDGRTDTTKQIIAFRNFSNAPTTCTLNDHDGDRVTTGALVWVNNLSYLKVTSKLDM
jgi:hypothetical protein